MNHIEIKQTARFELVVHRITGDRRQGNYRSGGYEKVHDAIEASHNLLLSHN